MSKIMQSWRTLITEEMENHNDSWDNIVSCTLTDEEMNEEFDIGYGTPSGKPFTLWTKSRVYFPMEYDGREECGSAARFPDGKAIDHTY